MCEYKKRKIRRKYLLKKKTKRLNGPYFFWHSQKCKRTRNFREILEPGKGFLNRLPWEQVGSSRQDLDALEPTAENFREILGAGPSCRAVSGFCPKISGKFWERTKTDIGGNRTLTATVFPRPWRFSTVWRFESPLVHGMTSRGVP